MLCDTNPAQSIYIYCCINDLSSKRPLTDLLIHKSLIPCEMKLGF